MNRVGTPFMTQTPQASSTVNWGSDHAIEDNFASQNLHATYPETYGRLHWRNSTARSITARRKVAAHWGLTIPALSVSDAVCVEYDVSAYIEFAAADTCIPFVFGTLVTSIPAAGSTASGDRMQQVEATIHNAGVGCLINAKGVMAFHGQSPQILGVSEYPVIGLGVASGPGGTVNHVSASIQLRRANYDETYPLYQDTLR